MIAAAVPLGGGDEPLKGAHAANVIPVRAKPVLLIAVGRWNANHLRVFKSTPIELFVADHHEERLCSADVPESHRTTDPQLFFLRLT